VGKKHGHEKIPDGEEFITAEDLKHLKLNNPTRGRK
jgi:hypothetical protein